MVAKYGTPEEKEKVRAAVKRKFPDIQQEGYQRDPEGQEKDRKTSKQTDPSKDGFTGIGNSIKDIMKQNAAMKKAAAKKKAGVNEDKALAYVIAKLKKQHGDNAVLTKGDKMPEPSAAQKKKNAEIRAKRAKEDGRDATEKATSGRYNDRSRSD
jgi:hypothetical protein